MKAGSSPPLVVGVFQDQSAEYINSIVEEVGIDLVQVRGGLVAQDLKVHTQEQQTNNTHNTHASAKMTTASC